MAKKTAPRVWMRVLNKDDAAELSKLLTARQTEWSEWECKVHRDNILVYVPITPWNHKSRKPDPSMRYMDKHWRVAPEPGGSLRLEYMRHTGQWWPVFDAVGDLKKIAGHIAQQAEASGYLTGSTSPRCLGKPGERPQRPILRSPMPASVPHWNLQCH